MISRNGGEVLLTAEGCDYAIVLRKVASDDKQTKNIKVDWLWDALSTFRYGIFLVLTFRC